MKTLTVFTPTYNRKHTLPRTFESLCRQTSDDFEWLIIDDGSSDGTREWVESLGEWLEVSDERLEDYVQKSFDWMGRVVAKDCEDGNHFFIQTPKFQIEYIYKPNGGLYTGYNVAYQTIKTELCVCIDSDDFMPDDAVEKILDKWKCLTEEDKNKYCGIVGLDYNVVDKKPIGGDFPKDIESAWGLEIPHVGDTKYVFRTELMREVAPQIGFEGEKDYNPHYMQVRVLDKLPILVTNDNFCWVEYQVGGDSMSQAIWKQYIRSPKSYAKYRINEMTLEHGNPWTNRFRLCVHYISSCMLSKDKNWYKNTPLKVTTLLAIPLGIVLTMLVLWKNRV